SPLPVGEREKGGKIRGYKCKSAMRLPAVFLFCAAGIFNSLQAHARISCRDCSVILISLDTLLADALGIHGYRRDISPNIDRLAGNGALFLNAYSHSPNTLSSHMSIFTSQYPWKHNMEAIYRDSLAGETVTLPMALKTRGYKTVWAATTQDSHLSLTAGFERGFDDFVPIRTKSLSWKPAFSWLKKNRGHKFFMFLHTYHVHKPYTPKKSSILRFSRTFPRSKIMTNGGLDLLALKEIAASPLRVLREIRIGGFSLVFRKLRAEIFLENFNPDAPDDMMHLRTLYDACVYEVDAAIGGLYAELEKLGLAGKTLLVITSDHGESFLEHGQLNHTQLYIQNLHVPLIFVFPGKQPGRKIQHVVQSIDITPTILDALGFPALQGAQGFSLLPLMEGRGSEGRSLAFAKWFRSYSVRDCRYTYIRSDNCADRSPDRDIRCVAEEFYDRSGDPEELKNIFSSNRDAAGKFAGCLSAMRASAPKRRTNPWPGKIPEDVRKRIRETGYW
ncbi:MAG: sulfatase, partial [bacterium]